MYTFSRDTLIPSGAQVFRAISDTFYNECYPLDSISVHYFIESSTFQLRIRGKRIISFNRDEVFLPASIDDDDLKSKLDNMVIL